MNICAELFAKSLKSKKLNYRSGISGDNSVIEFPYDGKIARLFFCGDKGTYLSVYLVYESVPKEKTVDVILTCNDLNAQYKWITFYVDRDNDVILHDDAILTPETACEEAFELLVRMLKISDEVKPVIMKAIYA